MKVAVFLILCALTVFSAVKCHQEGERTLPRGQRVVHVLNGEKGICIGRSLSGLPLVQFHSPQRGFYTVEIINLSTIKPENP